MMNVWRKWGKGMQIVIDISEEDYNIMCHNIAVNNPLCPLSQEEMVSKVANGTPLPKGHGRLIDVNDLLDRIGLEDNDTNREENVGEIITLEDFDYTPTIIEADRVESEDD